MLSLHLNRYLFIAVPRAAVEGCDSAVPQGGEDGLEACRRMAQDVQVLLRDRGSHAATCQIVQLQCRLSEYRGGVLDMTEEGAWAAEAAASADAAPGDSVLMIPDLPVSQMPCRLVLPDWDKLFAAATAASPVVHSAQNGEAAATLVVRQKSERRAARSSAVRTASQAHEKAAGVNASQRRSSSSERRVSTDSRRQFPPLRRDYLGALQLLHERQRQGRAHRQPQPNKEPHSSPENECHDEEALQLAAPPPFRKLSPAESLFSSVTEYLGCLAMDMPASKVRFTMGEMHFLPRAAKRAAVMHKAPPSGCHRLSHCSHYSCHLPLSNLKRERRTAAMSDLCGGLCKAGLESVFGRRTASG